MLYDAHTYNEKQILSDRSVSQNTHQTLVDLLRDSASHSPDQVAYTFLENGEDESHRLTYQQLDSESKGDRCLLASATDDW